MTVVPVCTTIQLTVYSDELNSIHQLNFRQWPSPVVDFRANLRITLLCLPSAHKYVCIWHVAQIKCRLQLSPLTHSLHITTGHAERCAEVPIL
jgi:hypothetical protein